MGEGKKRIYGQRKEAFSGTAKVFDAFSKNMLLNFKTS